MDNKRILLVEDDQSLQMALSMFLEDMGFEPVIASDPQQAAQAVEKGPYAAAIVDYFLGNVSTAGIIADLRRRHPAMPLVCSTGASAEQIRFDQAAESPTAFLFKPYGVKELRSTLQGVFAPR
jgi:DNA-binding NtrC family response regulator